MGTIWYHSKAKNMGFLLVHELYMWNKIQKIYMLRNYYDSYCIKYLDVVAQLSHQPKSAEFIWSSKLTVFIQQMHLHSLNRARKQIILSKFNIYYKHIECFQRTAQLQLWLFIHPLGMDMGSLLSTLCRLSSLILPISWLYMKDTHYI